jgi:hypothetical protein
MTWLAQPCRGMAHSGRDGQAGAGYRRVSTGTVRIAKARRGIGPAGHGVARRGVDPWCCRAKAWLGRVVRGWQGPGMDITTSISRVAEPSLALARFGVASQVRVRHGKPRRGLACRAALPQVLARRAQAPQGLVRRGRSWSWLGAARQSKASQCKHRHRRVRRGVVTPAAVP